MNASTFDLRDAASDRRITVFEPICVVIVAGRSNGNPSASIVRRTGTKSKSLFDTRRRVERERLAVDDDRDRRFASPSAQAEGRWPSSEQRGADCAERVGGLHPDFLQHLPIHLGGRGAQRSHVVGARPHALS